MAKPQSDCSQTEQHGDRLPPVYTSDLELFPVAEGEEPGTEAALRGVTRFQYSFLGLKLAREGEQKGRLYRQQPARHLLLVAQSGDV